jgi:SAM-dependent methyltransferase
MRAAAAQRDTDADWRELGATEPFWGVLTDPRFRNENLTPEGLDLFYESGRRDIADVAGRLAQIAGDELKVARALDFGCGVGRLSEAMCAYADEVVGYDISPGMLAQARQRSAGAVRYSDQPLEGAFDWINSFIVFQHIPPERGMALLGDLLDRLAAGGFISLHFTVWREPHLQPPRAGGQARRWLQGVKQRVAGLRLPTGTIHMFDYDLSGIVRELNLRGVQRMSMSSIDHGGHHGVLILARREP